MSVHCTVVGLARRKEQLDEISKKFEAKNGKFYSVKVDISQEGEILQAFEWIKHNVGPINILINSAGLGRNTNLIEGDAKMWKQVFDTNVFGLCVATREAVKNMRANNVDGHIIHINAILGHIVLDIPNTNVYPASKYAVTALAKTLRFELDSVGSKIKITSISPGLVNTEFISASSLCDNQDTINFIDKIPALEPNDVAEAVLYALGTPKHVQIDEIILKAIGESSNE